MTASEFTGQKNIRELNAPDPNAMASNLYIGVVVSINDPQQQGRVKVYIHGIHDPGRSKEYYVWAPVAQHLAGALDGINMGPEKELVSGITSYGTFSVPRPGTSVLVLFAYGRLSNPIVIGCLHHNNMMSGLPGGDRGQNEATGQGDRRQNITRLVNRLTEAFGAADSVVKATRGYEVTAATNTPNSNATAENPDVPKELRKDGTIEDDRNKSGYPQGNTNGRGPEYRIPASEAPDTQIPMMYSWTTPAQNTILMNDDPDNFRIRLRTLSGNQIIFDDTNQRIYLSTGRGENYIEMDEDGHIDIFANHRINIHSAQDINIKSDKQLNMEGAEGINLKSNKDIKIDSGASISEKATTSIYQGAGANIHQNAGTDIFHSAGTDIHQNAGTDIHMTAGGDVNADAGADVLISAGTNIHNDAGDSFLATAASSMHLRTESDNMLLTTTSPGVIHLNGPPATAADSAVAATAASSPVAANSPNRIPLKETSDWRSITKAPEGRRTDSVNLAHQDKSTTDPYSNRTEGGKKSISRPLNWRK
jgi:phage gp45-like